MSTTGLDAKAIMSAGTVAAIIRKDLRALWPFALMLALVQFVMAALFHVRADYPEVMLDLGRSWLHLGAMMMVFHAIGLPIVVATFIVLLVHQDPATDARNDWMARPVWALDIVTAKALVILAVVLVPSAIGNFAYVLTRDDLPIEVATGPIMFTLMGCIFMLVVAWLGSSTVQALLAPLVLAILTLLTILALGLPLTMRIADMGAQSRDRPQVVEVPQLDQPRPILPRATAAPPPPVAPAVPDNASPARADNVNPGIGAAQGRRLDLQDRTNMRRGAISLNERRAPAPTIDLTWPFLVVEFLLVLAAAGVVLWLLLVRRRLMTARLTFLGFFVAATLFMLFGGGIVTPRDEMFAFVDVALPAPTRPPAPEPERLAAFASNDLNKDNRLDRQEYAAVLDELGFSDQIESLWAQRDANRDGFITIEEYRASIPSVPATAPAPAPVTSEPQRLAAFASNDADKDGRLDRWEYAALLDELGFSGQFDSLWNQRDIDRNGFVSIEEYRNPIPQ